MISKILVLGGGSAGFLAALTLKKILPQLEVTILRSPAIGVIGVGEGTTFTVPNYLHGFLEIDPSVFHRQVRPTYKLGIRFLWGPRPRFHYTFTSQLNVRFNELPKPNGFYCDGSFDFADLNSALMAHDRAFERQADGGPLVNTDMAYHLENEPFVQFLESHATTVAGVRMMEDTVEGVEQDDHGICRLGLASGASVSADLYVDCSGFRAELISRALGEPFLEFRSSLLCDRAVVGGWSRDEEPLLPFTTAETMDSGWVWQIEHQPRINRGYVYSSDFIRDEDAEAEFRQKNPKVESTRVVRYVSGRYRRSWVKNVVAIGNASGFVEPLESTSLATICQTSAALARALQDGDCEIRATHVDQFNRLSGDTWDHVRRFLALHYKFNSRLDTPFWRACRADVDLAGAEPIVEYYRENGPSLLWSRQLLGVNDPFSWEGYLAMLVGQRVPYNCRHDPAEEETTRWNAARAKWGDLARKALTQEDALRIIHSDGWRWRPDFYKQAATW